MSDQITTSIEDEATRENERARAAYVRNLRNLASFIEANPNVPVPYSTDISFFASSLDEARSYRAGSYGWVKDASGPYIDYRQTWPGVNEYGKGSVTYEIAVNKERTCRKVQIGTRTVPAVEAVAEHEEPVYEWVCDDTEDEAVTEA